MPEGSGQRQAARFGIDAVRAPRASTSVSSATSSVVPACARRASRRTRTGTSTTTPTARRSPSSARCRRTWSGPIGIECVVVQRGRVHSLKRTLQSIREQTWGHWQVTLIGPDAESTAAGAHDDRVRAHHVTALGALAEVNPVLEHEPGRDFVMVIEAGDTLAPDCFFEIAHLARQDPLLDLISWDDDRLDVQGRRTDPQFRPSWSPDMLLGANYIGRSFAMRHRRFAAVGGLRTEFGDACWWDLILRAGLDETRVGRVPRVLSHLTRRPNPSVVQCVNVVEDHIARNELPATVTFERGTARITWHPAEWPHVTVVVPTRHNRPLVSRVLEGRGGYRLPVARRRRRRQRRPHRRQRALVRGDVPRRRAHGGVVVRSRSTTRRSTTPARRARAARSWCSSTTTPSSPIPGGCARWSRGPCGPASAWSARSSSTAPDGSSTAV